MSEKHYPYVGGSFERIIFDGDGSVWVPEAENAKLRELCVKALEWLRWAGGITCPPEVPDEFADELRELGMEVDV